MKHSASVAKEELKLHFELGEKQMARRKQKFGFSSCQCRQTAPNIWHSSQSDSGNFKKTQPTFSHYEHLQTAVTVMQVFFLVILIRIQP